MAKVSTAKNDWTMVMRWTARVLALAVVGLFVPFAAEFGSTVFSALSWSNPQATPLLIALLLALVGVVIAWRWELMEGIMALAGALAIMRLVCLGSGGDMLLCAVFSSLPLLVAGMLYLGSACMTRLVQLGASPSLVKAGIAQMPKHSARRSATSAPLRG